MKTEQRIGEDATLDQRMQALECLVIAVADALPTGSLPVVQAYFASAVESVRSGTTSGHFESFEAHASRLAASLGRAGAALDAG